MKITQLPMGLMEIQAETADESQAICGIEEMIFKFMPAAVANRHGCRKRGRGYYNYCTVPDGSMAGPEDAPTPGIDKNIKTWRKLHDMHFAHEGHDNNESKPTRQRA